MNGAAMFAASRQAVNSARDRLSAYQRLLGIRPASRRAGFQAALVIDDIAVPTDDRDVARHAALDSAELLRPGTPRAIAAQSGDLQYLRRVDGRALLTRVFQGGDAEREGHLQRIEAFAVPAQCRQQPLLDT